MTERSLRLGVDLNKADLVWISQLVAIRRLKNISVEEVAHRMGVDQTTISNLENQNNGNRSANIALLSKYARAIGAYTGHFVIDAESEEDYKPLKQAIENYTRALLFDEKKNEVAATVYKVANGEPQSRPHFWSASFSPNRAETGGEIWMDSNNKL